MNKLRVFWDFLKRGAFSGNHKPIRFDEHSLAATGNDEPMVWVAEDTHLGIPRHWRTGYFKPLDTEAEQ